MAIEELDIDELFDKLRQTNRVLGQWTRDDSDLGYPLAFEEAQELSDLILGKPRVVRENYFSRRTKAFSEAIEKEDYHTADIVLSDLKYFAHCFLDEKGKRTDTRTETLKLIADTMH
ncbi:Uncharacterised protein [uncultured archaeon]|nr:Uncharacterised protein [uncultured archaeon]